MNDRHTYDAAYNEKRRQKGYANGVKPKFSFKDGHTRCLRGHDLTIADALDKPTVYGSRRCAQCRRDRDAVRAEQRRKERAARGHSCRLGHPLVGKNVLIVTRSNGKPWHGCKTCLSKNGRSHGGDNTTKERDRTREILEFDRRIENEPVAYRKAEIREEKAALLSQAQ